MNHRDDELRQQALAIGRRLAVELFDALSPSRQFRPTDRRILMAAALLHDVGMTISFQKHHKHSFKMITEAELPGLTTHERILAAHVARYHRKSEPAERHAEYAELNEEDREAVNKLAAILRVADVLDRDHTQRVRGLAVTAVEHEMTIDVGDAPLTDPATLARKAALFERVFGCAIRFVGQPTADERQVE
jgi:exopolyphosphatase/guanosine-5'-triphosphate,3'-diphosphate pyrophosphatase